MEKINMLMLSAYLKTMSQIEKFRNDERGEVNMIAIVLIIIVVIGLVAVFKEGIKGVLEAAFTKIKTAIQGISTDA